MVDIDKCEYNKISKPENYFADLNKVPEIYFVERNNPKNFTYPIHEVKLSKEVYNKTFSLNKENDEDIGSTKEQTSKEQIFKIKKVSKIAGRRKLKSLHLTPVKHGRSSKDNIVTKIKTCFINSGLNYINKEYKLFLEKRGKKVTPLLKKIAPKFPQAYKKTENQTFLNKKMKDIFSMNVSKKCTKYSPDYNKNQIDKLYQKNEAKEVIKILETNVKEFYEEYISEDKKIEGFNIEEDIKEMANKNNLDKEYLEKFRNTSMELIEILNKKGRNSKTK